MSLVVLRSTAATISFRTSRCSDASTSSTAVTRGSASLWPGSCSKTIATQNQNGECRCAGPGGPRYRSRTWRDNSPKLWLAKQRECILKRLHAREPKGYGSRIRAAKLLGQCRDTLAMTVRLSRRSGFGNSLTTEGKRHIKRGGAADDILSDPQPVRREVGVADPRLPIRQEWIPGWHNRSWRRQVQEITTGQQDLWAEEVVTLRQNDRARERDG